MSLSRSLLVTVAVLSLFAGSCANKEKAARSIYNQALALEREGNQKKAKELFERIVTDYPETAVATEANKQLNVAKAIDEAKREAEETAAGQGVRSIGAAQIAFAAAHEFEYASSIKELVDGDLLSERFLSHSTGYTYSLSRTPKGFSTSAAPIEDAVRNRHFFLDESQVIRCEVGKPATAASPKWQ